jgi:hypothetical protein
MPDRDSNMMSVDKVLPVPNRRVIVVCKRFQCLGYIGRGGTWRDDSRNKELKDVIGWHDVLDSAPAGRWG